MLRVHRTAKPEVLYAKIIQSMPFSHKLFDYLEGDMKPTKSRDAGGYARDLSLNFCIKRSIVKLLTLSQSGLYDLEVGDIRQIIAHRSIEASCFVRMGSVSRLLSRGQV